MTKPVAPPPPQFLREDAIRGGMDLLMFAHKSHLQHADDALAAHGLFRAHHRALYFISRNPGCTVSELLETLGVKKQSLGRVLTELADRGFLMMRVGERDRRTRLLYLTDSGKELEGGLFEELHSNMARAYEAAGKEAVGGYWALMQHLMDAETHARFLLFNSKPAARSHVPLVRS